MSVRLVGDRVVLAILPPARASDVVAFHRENAAHLAPWSPPRPEGFLTEEHWRGRLSMNRSECDDGVSLRLHVLTRGESEVIGEASLSQIFRGPFQNAFLGYSLAQRFEGRGLMSESLRLLVTHAFGGLRLHRVQANHLPENERSARLLRRLGFRREGLAQDYLFIAGRWRDHVMTALTNPAHPGP